MFNYVWGGIVAISLIFALVSDLSDGLTDRYRNGTPMTVHVHRADAAGEVSLRLIASDYASHFGVMTDQGMNVRATFRPVESGMELALVGPLPEPLATMRRHLDDKNERLPASAAVTRIEPGDTIALSFRPVRLVKLSAMSREAIRFAQTAFEVAISLIGGLCLWLGLLKIAEDAGLVALLVRVVQPVLRPLFPSLPKDHPALAYIALGVAGNMLAIGNAATPIGIKAMQELQKTNPNKDVASNAMVMLLAINTAGVTLLPGASLLALLGLRVNDIMPAIWLATAGSMVVAIAAVFLLGRLPVFRRTDPDLNPAGGER
jgi:spore maturation protein A